MELRQLKYFLAAAKNLNFTLAAQECYIVQSAMSQQIALLEKELHVALFERGGRTLALTPAGEALLREANRILQHVDASVDLVRNVSSGYHQTLRIGCHGNLLRDSFADMLCRFRQQQPGVRVLLTHGIANSLLDMLKSEQIDGMVSVYSPEFKVMDWLDSLVLREESVCMMLPANHHLAGSSPVRMERLWEEPVILINGSDKKSRLIHWADTGRPMKVYCYADDHSSVETLVAAGYGVSLCLRSACRQHPALTYVDIEGNPTEKICVSWKRLKAPFVEQTLRSLFMMHPAD